MQKSFHTKYYRLLLVVLLHALSLLSGAQHYPIQVNTIITPPYSGRLSDYTESGFERVQMIINPLDLSLQSYKVKIKLVIESLDGRVRIQSDPNYLPPPVYLNGGVTEVITSYDLQEIFNVSHLIFMRGITKNEYLVKKRLPENYYRIGFVLLDYNHATMGGTSNEVIVSNFGYTQAGIFLNDPPILNLPNNQMRLPLYDPQRIVLQWTPRHRGSPNSAFSTEYVIRLYEVWNEGYSAAAIAQTQVPIYETTTTDTRYLYGISDPMLVPGNKYVWTVQARDADGRDMFRNDGLSEAYMFQWGESCKIPEAFTAVPVGGPAMELSWKTATGHTDYDIQYRTAGNAQWYEENSLLTNTRITNLAYSKSYETRIRANCGSYSSEYSLPIVIKMPEPPQQNFACGTAGMLVPVRSSAPLSALPSGAIFFAGGFECHVIEARNENGGFTGSCYVVVPYYGFAKVLHTFKDIRINTDLQMFSGKLISVTDTVKGALLAQKIDEAGSNNNTGYSDEQLQANLEADTIVHINGRIDKISVNDEGNIVVTMRNGDEEVIEVEEGKSVVISDKDGEQYYVDNGQVKTGDQALADKNTESTGEQVVADLNAARKALPLVYFSPSNNTQYGYDSLRFEALRRQYGVNTLLNKEYVIPYKAVASGKMDALDARMPEKSTFDGKGLSFRINETPAMATGEKSSRLKTVNVAPLANGDEQVLNAVYTLVDTAGNKAEEILGQVNIVAYDEQLIKLIIVPVGNKIYSESAIRETINDIYRQSVTQWDIQWDKEFLWTLADSFDDTDKDNRMDYTSDMKALIREYKAQRDIDRQAVYVFLYSGAHVSALEGYMPFNKQFAFVFTKDNDYPAFIAKNISHEIAHGTFNLRHVFSDDNTYYQSSGTSNNLMDYKRDVSAVQLNKYQWDLIHNPQSVLFSWLEEESEGEMGSFLVSPLIEAIRKANFDKKTNLDLDQKRNYGAFTDDIKLGKEKFTYIGLRAGYSLDPKDLYKIFSETLKIDPSEYSRSSIRYENDNEKYVKYEFHQLEMTKLPAPYINTIKPGEKTVVQFVVKESEANNFEAYIYNVQNKLPMDDCEYRGYSFGNWKPNSAKYGCTRNDNDYDCNKDQIYGDRPHHGIDIYASPGTTIYAVADGEITWADVISGYGSVVALKCKLTNLTTQQRQDVIVMYAHLETISVSKGQEVKAGNVLGTTGMSGAEFLIDYPDEMHLHLEIITKWWPDGFVDRFDPSQYFKIKEPTN